MMGWVKLKLHTKYEKKTTNTSAKTNRSQAALKLTISVGAFHNPRSVETSYSGFLVNCGVTGAQKYIFAS